ncbi:MAG TPA: hypothetical protein VG796_26025 [Verrucomicrobiales bacterium]|jgi:hypothetical protein|nr:hypothetical protein [Verrucomicrobiales bacterium]
MPKNSLRTGQLSSGSSSSPGQSSDERDLAAHIVSQLAEIARLLAIKGFSPDEVAARERICSLKVHSKAHNIEGHIEFELLPGDTRGIGWRYSITSDRLKPESTQGILEGPGDNPRILQTIMAFFSVFTTAASFSGNE